MSPHWLNLFHTFASPSEKPKTPRKEQSARRKTSMRLNDAEKEATPFPADAQPPSPKPFNTHTPHFFQRYQFHGTNLFLFGQNGARFLHECRLEKLNFSWYAATSLVGSAEARVNETTKCVVCDASTVLARCDGPNTSRVAPFIAGFVRRPARRGVIPRSAPEAHRAVPAACCCFC